MKPALLPRKVKIASPARRPDQFTILIAEDDPNDAFFLQWALRRNDPQKAVQIVADGDEAITYLEHAEADLDSAQYPRPKLLILDLKMPRKSALDVLQWIRSRPAFQDLPAIVLSSYGQWADISDCYRLGANAFVTKPTRFEDLQHMLKSIEAFWGVRKKPISADRRADSESPVTQP